MEARSSVAKAEEMGGPASAATKSLGMLTFLSYICLGYYFLHHRVQFLDDWTDWLLAGNRAVCTKGDYGACAHFVVGYPLHRFTQVLGAAITYLSGFGKFQLAVVGTIIVHQLVYWTLSLPDMIYQMVPALRKYKIQDRDCSMELQWYCFKNVLYNQWVIESPIVVFNFYFCAAMGFGWDWQSFPRWYQIVAGLIGAMALEDTWHFVFHWVVHQHPKLYQFVHKQHHRFITPVGMQAEFASATEVMLLGVGFALGCSFYCTNFFMTWVWMAIRLTETIEVHSGYDIPLFFNPLHYLPFYAGARFHDFHHSNFVGNYSSTFSYWDSIFETDLDYRAAQAKRSAGLTGGGEPKKVA